MITLRTFSGERPIVEPLNLSGDQASYTLDCYLHSSGLDPIRENLYVAAGYASAQTLYKVCGEVWYMSEWTTFAPSPIIDDQYNRHYWTQCSNPGLMVGDKTLMTHDVTGTNLSDLAGPTVPAGVVIDRGGAVVTPVDVRFVMTFIDTCNELPGPPPTGGIESAPSIPSDVVQYIDGVDGVDLTLMVPQSECAGGGYRFGRKRIYAEIGGLYYLVDELPRAQTNWSASPLVVDATAPVVLPVYGPPPGRPPVRPGVSLVVGGDAVRKTAFVYTWVTIRDEETAPSVATSVITYDDGSDCATFSVPLPTNPDIRYIRLYMAVEGSYFVLEEIDLTTLPMPLADPVVVSVCPLDDDFLNDPDPDSIIGAPLTSDNYDPAPDTLCGLEPLPNGVLAGFTHVADDCEETSTVHFSEPYQPHAWPVDYRRKVGFKAIAGIAVPEGFLVVGLGKGVIFTGATPEVMREHPLETFQSCLDPRSVIRLGRRAYWSCPDGVAVYSGYNVEVLSNNVWSREQWQRLNPNDMVFGAYEEHLVIYPQSPDAPDGTRRRRHWQLAPGQGILYSVTRQDVVRLSQGEVHAAMYDYEDDALYVARGDLLERFNESDTYMQAQWISKPHILPGARTLNSARIEPEGETLVGLYRSKPQSGVERDGRGDEEDVPFWEKPKVTEQPFRIGSGGRRWNVRMGFTLLGRERLRAAFFSDDMRQIP